MTPGSAWTAGFYGVRPFTGPVQVTGQVRNRADALVLTGAAAAVLDFIPTLLGDFTLRDCHL